MVPGSASRMPTADQLPSPRARFAGNPALSGHKGGLSTDLRAMAASGITLLGRIDGVDGQRLRLAPGLAATLDHVGGFFDERMAPMIGRYIEAAGEIVPLDDNRWSDFQPPELDELDLARTEISSVVWASGFRPDYRWLDVPDPRRDGPAPDAPWA